MDTTKLTANQIEALKEFITPESPDAFKIHLMEQGLFIDELRNDPSVKVRFMALLKSPQDKVDDFVSDISEAIRTEVVKMTSSDEVLEILANDPIPKVREAVARRKFDKRFLNDQYGIVKAAAIESGIDLIDKIITDADPDSQWM